MKVTITLKDNSKIHVRFLQKIDEEKLFRYFTQLSVETKSRFGPHFFDKDTVKHICNEQGGDTTRYIALDDKDDLIAYMLVKKGMNDGERYRLLQHNIAFDETLFCSFAPSVTDAWQSSGLGTAMYEAIENDIRSNTPFRFIILWGGVQVTNDRAVRYYEKHAFKHAGAFWYDGKDNYDMIKSL